MENNNCDLMEMIARLSRLARRGTGGGPGGHHGPHHGPHHGGSSHNPEGPHHGMPPGPRGHHGHGAHRLLGHVLQNEGVRTTQLAEMLDIRPSSLTEALNRLEENGLIRREKDEHDARVSRIYPTEKAQEAHKEKEAQRAAQNARLQACLAPEEMEMFCRAADKLCAFMEKEYPAPCKGGHGGCSSAHK